MTAPVASAGMLIRRPAGEVFAAFVDPVVTARFWFTHGDAPLTPGARVVWTWGMYGASTAVQVKAIARGRAGLKSRPARRRAPRQPELALPLRS